MSEIPEPDRKALKLVRDHSRRWQNNRYVYPVISRRSRGLSVGINLNPDTACNFDCIYCQVDRSDPDRGAKVDLAVLDAELREMIEEIVAGRFFDEPRFRDVPQDMKEFRDIAFSGDGEPTASPKFLDAVRIAARLKDEFRLDGVKIVLITDACYLARPKVRQALEVMDGHNGEIWAKLDAGTEDYFRLVNRPNIPLREVLENIIDAARAREIVIQSLWMHIRDQPPPDAEVRAFADRLNEIQAAGGRIKLVQVHTIARKPAEPHVTALSPSQVERIADLVSQHARVRAEAYYAPED
ncbi:MAG: radical SAM protein [Phycisphaerales bacterium]|nr:MAG: radical SAM protein [Phycisphaerales bacterium]